MAKRARVLHGLPRLRQRDDRGSLMILAGIILTLGFIVTSLTLAQVSTLEREAAADRASPLIQEWRFLHERLATNLNVSISEETSNDTFENVTLGRISATFRNVQAEKGYDTVIRLANGTFANGAWGVSERSLVSNTTLHYEKAYTLAGNLVTADPWDGKDTGMLWQNPCPVPGPPTGCIVGVYLYVRLSDGDAAVEEIILFPVNQP